MDYIVFLYRQLVIFSRPSLLSVRKGIISTLIFAFTSTAFALTPGYIYTFAGTGSNQLTAGSVGNPGSLSADPSGNIYSCDVQNAVVWQINPSGTPTVFAGGGTSTVNGTLATNLHLVNCQGLAFDAGKLYISDESTVWSVSLSGSSYVANAFAGAGSTTATSISPSGLAVDSAHNVYISSVDLVLVANPQGTSITTFAGSSTNGFCGDGGSPMSACLNYPQGLAFDASGNLYIADSQNFRIRKVTPAPYSVISTFAGDGVESTSITEIDLVHDIKFDATGNLYLAQDIGNLIREIPKGGGAISNYAGSGGGNCYTNYYDNLDNVPATSASLSCPYGIAFNSGGVLYIGDFTAARIREVIPIRPPSPCTIAGNICTVAGNVTNLTSGSFCGDGTSALGACLNNPAGLFVDSSNNIFVADSYNNRVREFSLGGNIQTVAGNGNGGSYVWDSGDPGAATQATTNTPTAVSEDGSGNLIVLDQFANGNVFPMFDSDTYSTIREVSLSTGQISTLLGNWATYGTPYNVNFMSFSDDLAFGSNTNSNNGVVGSGFYVAGAYAVSFVSNLPTQVGLSTQTGAVTSGPATAIALDSNGNIYFSSGQYTNDQDGSIGGTYTIQMVDTGGNITTIAGNGNPTYSGEGGLAINAGMMPGAIAVDGVGDIFITDQSVSAVRVIPAGGHSIYTIAGDPTQSSGYSGDGGPATSAALNHPGGLKTDASGNLYISDSGNNLIRKVTLTPSFVHALYAGAASPTTSYTTLTSSASTALSTSGVTLTASVNRGNSIPTGTVTFAATPSGGSTTTLATAYVSNGGATYTGELPIGTDSITAVYSGDSNYLASTSNSLTVTVASAPVSALQLTGYRDSSDYACGVESALNGVPPGIAGLVIAAGDQLVFNFQQNLPSMGGMALIFTDGTGTGAAVDSNGTQQPLYFDAEADGQWHRMMGDLSQFAGKTTSYVLVGLHQSMPTGYFTMNYTNAAIVHSDGTEVPIFVGQAASVPAFTGTTCGGQNMTSGTVLLPQ